MKGFPTEMLDSSNRIMLSKHDSWILRTKRSADAFNLGIRFLLATIEEFHQLAEVIRVCRASHTLSEAGRTLFALTRLERKTANDADRLQKYLARFGTDWDSCRTG